jgi:two-component system chemotaxis sensor kinase CheA
MGGAVALASRAGEGTTVSLRLPLTVAIVPALLVGVADQRFAVPLGFVAETTRLTGGGTAGGTTGRGDEVPIVELPASGPAAPVGPRPGVILEVGGRRAALAVDTLLGQEDIVLGPLVAPQGTPRWINGATILADGRPALVLDPTALVQGSP